METQHGAGGAQLLGAPASKTDGPGSSADTEGLRRMSIWLPPSYEHLIAYSN